MRPRGQQKGHAQENDGQGQEEEAKDLSPKGTSKGASQKQGCGVKNAHEYPLLYEPMCTTIVKRVFGNG